MTCIRAIEVCSWASSAAPDAGASVIRSNICLTEVWCDECVRR
jgi:hypothetical protein